MTFTGREIAVIAPKGPKRGKAKIYVDGVYIKTISLRATSSPAGVVFTRAFGSGTHTIKCVVGTDVLVRLDAPSSLSPAGPCVRPAPDASGRPRRGLPQVAMVTVLTSRAGSSAGDRQLR
jgi:hypothetical protein